MKRLLLGTLALIVGIAGAGIWGFVSSVMGSPAPVVTLGALVIGWVVTAQVHERISK